VQSGEVDGIIPVRLERGENVHAGLLQACARHSLECGFVVSGIGMLEDPELGFLTSPGNYDHRQFTGRFELLNLSGNIAQHEGQAHAHLHVTLGNPDYTLLGGHLFAATVGVTVEVLLLRVPAPLRLERQFEAASGVPGLQIRS
jgi:predicted DNA-binding protein with PD1-like motif